MASGINPETIYMLHKAAYSSHLDYMIDGTEDSLKNSILLFENLKREKEYSSLLTELNSLIEILVNLLKNVKLGVLENREHIMKLCKDAVSIMMDIMKRAINQNMDKLCMAITEVDSFVALHSGYVGSDKYQNKFLRK